uniref:Kinesin motor domain-containing protein n=1 Tax=Ascaris lumbricoides TaxID=6252 RepID=A0A0M3I269_ASCLU
MALGELLTDLISIKNVLPRQLIPHRSTKLLDSSELVIRAKDVGTAERASQRSAVLVRINRYDTLQIADYDLGMFS